MMKNYKIKNIYYKNYKTINNKIKIQERELKNSKYNMMTKI